MDKYTKKQSIKDIREGDIINDIFVVKIKKSVTPYIKGYSFSLILTDSSGGSIEYKHWGCQDENEVKRLFDSINPDDVVLLNGKVSTYKNKLQISADSIGILNVLSPDEYEADFIRVSEKDINGMHSYLLLKIDSMQDEKLKKFLKEIFNEDMLDKFKRHPGAIQIHHNWIGGLLQHTLEVIEYCETSVLLYPELDRDLLITGAILHDIGKLEELEMTSRIKGTRKGQLVGHLVLGLTYLNTKLEQSDLNGLLKDKLLHLLVSHHGKGEYGSPKEPMIPEALVLYYADELSSKISEVIDFIKENKEKTEDDFMPKWPKNRPTNFLLK